ncbi:MAG TPA: ABC transporter permease, partial [Stellaceae bacterium]|nr:ABC transporter permease [Stellaceae bacterium]
LAPPLCYLTITFLYPLLRAVWGSFYAPDFSIEAYARIWRVPVYGQVFGVTLRISVLTTVICALLGYLTAYFISTVPPAVRRILLIFVVVPFILNILVRNYVWIILLQRNGLINQAFMALRLIDQPLVLMHNESGVLIGMVSTLLPYMILSTLSGLLTIPGELRLASASLGGGPFRTFRRVTMPLSLPGAAAGALIVFIVSVGFFITPALLGGPHELMISNLIAFNVNQTLNWRMAFSLSDVLLAATLILYFLYRRWLQTQLGPEGLFGR